MGCLPDCRSPVSYGPLRFLDPSPSVGQPLLPAPTRHIDGIDRSRYDSNFAPLRHRLKVRLAGHFGVAPERAVTVANGTLRPAAGRTARRSPRRSRRRARVWSGAG
jgi:hypothetical protein